VFDTNRKGFVPLPILLRKLMRHLSAPELRVLVYLHLRVSKHGICYPTQEKWRSSWVLAHKESGAILEEARGEKADLHEIVDGKKFYLVHDPRIGLQHLIDTGVMRAEELEELNQLCSDLSQTPFEAQQQLPSAHSPPTNH